MKRKIYDIKPPKKKEDLIPEKDFKIERRSRKNIVGYVLSAILLVIFFLWIFVPASSATIYITPKTSNLKTEAIVTGVENLERINVTEQKIPIYLIEKEITISKVFPTSLTDVSEKAEGIIRVFNKYKTRVILVAGTRFMSATEPARIFYSTKKIVIPAGGYIDVKVVASEPGEDYNIEPTTFSVPGLRNYSPPQLYYSVYGKSFKKMSGGRTAKIAKVTQEDLDNAKKELTKEIENKALEELRKFVGENYILLDKTLDTELISSGPFDVVVGQETKNFTYQLKIKAKVKALKKEDVDNFAKHFVDSQIPPEKEIYEDSVTTKIGDINISLDKTITIGLEISSIVYPNLDKVLIREISKKQTKKQILKHLTEIYPDVKVRPYVKFKPFFARRAPSRDRNIDIKIIMNSDKES